MKKSCLPIESSDTDDLPEVINIKKTCRRSPPVKVNSGENDVIYIDDDDVEPETTVISETHIMDMPTPLSCRENDLNPPTCSPNEIPPRLQFPHHINMASTLPLQYVPNMSLILQLLQIINLLHTVPHHKN